ncbi:MAG: hypothetical protein HXS46_17270 [Theionarchaea archaeon]|nr:hypothetical protein [Theionarchaea archaeon]
MLYNINRDVPIQQKKQQIQEICIAIGKRCEKFINFRGLIPIRHTYHDTKKTKYGSNRKLGGIFIAVLLVSAISVENNGEFPMTTDPSYESDQAIYGDVVVRKDCGNDFGITPNENEVMV